MTGNPHAYKMPWLLRVRLIFRSIMGHNVIVDPELIASFEFELSGQVRRFEKAIKCVQGVEFRLRQIHLCFLVSLLDPVSHVAE